MDFKVFIVFVCKSPILGSLSHCVRTDGRVLFSRNMGLRY